MPPTAKLPFDATLTVGTLPFETEAEWKDFFEKFGENGRTFQDFTQLTPQSMEVIYMVAYNQYNAGRYEEAEKIFQLLSVLNHFEVKYWTGLAASRELLGKHAEALKAYGYLGMLDIHNPLPPFQSAKCFIAMGRVEDAETGLRAAIANAEGHDEHSAIQQQAEGLLELLQNNKKTNTTSQP